MLRVSPHDQRIDDGVQHGLVPVTNLAPPRKRLVARSIVSSLRDLVSTLPILTSARLLLLDSDASPRRRHGKWQDDERPRANEESGDEQRAPWVGRGGNVIVVDLIIVG